MAADGDALLAGTIANPRLWRLGMLLDMEARTLTVAATSTVGEEGDLPHQPGAAFRLGLPALEDYGHHLHQQSGGGA